MVEGGSSYFMCRLEGGLHYVMQWQEQAHGKLCIGKLVFSTDLGGEPASGDLKDHSS